MELSSKALDTNSDNEGREKGTGSFMIESEIEGREHDKNKLLELILPNHIGKTKGGVFIIPIVGIGGIGKTTLVRLVYNDEKVTQYFNLKIWVYVSENFDVRKLMIAIVESATKKRCKFLEMDLLQSQLQQSLYGKRFLLVLDDVWNEDQRKWDEVGDLLKSCMVGSKIIVTTRSTKIASVMGIASPYHLEGLHEDDCWKLFKKQAFLNEEEVKNPNLLKIGRAIIKKCGGIPLAAKSVGSLLRFKTDEKDWLFVQESELWDIKECQKGIFPALLLSYYHLPKHLKRCFVFCSFLPKHFEIQKEKLIHIWMAECLIQQVGRNRRLEDIGDEYFHHLLDLSFFQEVEECEDGSTMYRMHNLIHDLARSIGGNKFLTLDHGLAPRNIAQTRHLSVVRNLDLSSFPHDLFEAEHLRTIIFMSPGGNPEELSSHLPAKFIYLRVLDLSGCSIKIVPESVCDLICLRYLNLSNTSIQKLPHTLCSLCNLQTLDLSGCYNLVELPFGITRLVSLRHLRIKGCEELIQMPPGIGNLVDLQSLSTYIVGKGTGESIAELFSLNLRGELNIKCMENVSHSEEARKANLKGKHLQLLRYQWGDNYENQKLKAAKTTSSEVKYGSDPGSSELSSQDVGTSNNVENILECLEPHPNLQKLFVEGYPGVKFPNWVLPNLVVIAFINCRRCECLPALGHLPFLKTLCLQGMDGVTCIDVEFYGGGTQKIFPVLENFLLNDFQNLVNWSSIDGREAFPCVQKLIVDKCPNLTTALIFPSIQHLELRDCQNLEKCSSIDGREAFPSMQKLIVDKCPKLTTAPVFPSIQHLELRDCHSDVIYSMKNMTSLSVLVIDTFPELKQLSGKFMQNNRSLVSLKILSCRNLHSLPSQLELLTALKTLIIRSCDKLSYLPLRLQNLKSLEFLDISGCHSMILLPSDGIGGLSSLQNLSIENCSNLISLSSGLCQLTALHQLSIMSCPKLTLFPDGLHNLAALRSLNIVSCPELRSLPWGLQHVTTIQSIVIHGCPGLTTLPDWFLKFSSLRSLTISDCKYLKSLPEGLNLPSTLQHLSIQDCPLLERLCKNQGGKEWRKIDHIPHKYIGSSKSTM